MGCLLFVSTSAAQDEMQPLAELFGVAGFTMELLGSRPGFSKGPEHVAYIQLKYDLLPGHMAMVGDDKNDLVLAHAAGIFAVGITGTENRGTLAEAGADLVIDTLTELQDYVG
jgi:phosphoglycolate phosphatase-like HAD superfamily hydrolase